MNLAEGISVVVPVFNSAGTIPELTGRLTRLLETITDDFEVILVDDGSRDESWKEIQAIAALSPRIVPIRLTKNFGQHNALLCGIRKARFPVTVTMDDDLQHPPEEIPRLLGMLGEFDVMYGAPARQQHGLARDVASTVTKIVLSRLIGADNARHISAFRAFKTHLRDGFDDYDSAYVSIDVLLTWATDRFGHVTVQHDARSAGPSNYTVGRLLRHALDLLTGFSVIPLQVASILGFGAMVFGFALLAYVLLRWAIQGSSVPGFTFLASTISILGGVQLFALGLMGEYLARIHVHSMAKPPYVENVENVVSTD